MRRAAFLVATGSAIAASLVPVLGRAGTATIVAVSCNVEDLAEEAEDRLADALQARGVSVVAPEAMDVSVRVQSRLYVTQWLGGGVADYSYFGQISRRYHAARALLADVDLRASSLPYGDFTVYSVRGTCAYRCFNTADKSLVAAGSFSAKGRSEDVSEAQQRSLGDAVLALARQAAPHLN